MGKGSRRRRENCIASSSSIEPSKDENEILQCTEDKDKDNQISQPFIEPSKDENKILRCTEDKDKDNQISQPCKRCEDEICNLLELNKRLIKDFNSSRQDFKACFMHKVAEMESQIRFLQEALINFESKIDNQFIQEVKIGEQLSDQLMEVDKQFRQQLAKRDEEYGARISKAWQQLQEAEERFTIEISEKEKDCRAVLSEKQTLESSVLQLTDKIKVISAEFNEARKAWELEKDGLFLQIASAQKETEEMAESRLIAEHAWITDKENHLSSLRRTYEKKIEDLCALNQRVLFEKIESESQLNESKERTRELLEKLEDDRHLWDSEKQKLQENAAELQTKIDSIVSEGGLLCQKNRALCAEIASLKTQLNENITRIAPLQDEKVQNERLLQQYRTENVDLQSSWNDSKAKTQDLLRKIEEDTHLWDAEKNNLESQLNESKQRIRELLEKLEDNRHLRDSEKQKLQYIPAELQTKIDSMASEGELLCRKNKALSTDVESLKTQLNANMTRIAQMHDERVQNERVLLQYRTENVDLQSGLNDSKAKTQDLLRKIEEDTHLWDAEKNNLESQLKESKRRTRELLEKLEDDRHLWDSEKQKLQYNAAELQTKIDSMASGSVLLSQKNRALSAEVESLKTQLNENITRIAHMQDERVQNERVLQQHRTENIDLQSNLNDSNAKIQDLLRKIKEETHLFDDEKNRMEGIVAELRAEHELMVCEMGTLTLKNRELTADVELIKSQVNALESALNESRKSNLELQRKNEDDWHLWDKKKSNLESTLAELQTKHKDLMLQLSRKKVFEEEILSRMSSLAEMRESISKGEIKIANLGSQILAVVQEKDGQLSDIQGQLSAMAEEKKSQLASLEDQLSSIAEGKKILEGENKYLQTELDRRTLVAEEEQVRLEVGVRELQITFNSLDRELESSRAIALEKERQFVDLQNRHSELVEAKRCLENKNDSLLTEIDRCTMVSEENIRLQKTIGDLEMAVESLKKDIETKDNRLQKLMSERQPPSRIPLVPVANGKAKRSVSVNETPKSNGVVHENENEESKVTPEKRTVRKPLVPRRNVALNENPKPTGGGVHENEKSKSMVTPEKRTTLQKREARQVTPTPKALAERRLPNVARAPQNPKSTRFQ